MLSGCFLGRSCVIAFELHFRQQLQHSANRLAKETNEYLKELGSLPLPLSASEQVGRQNFLDIFLDHSFHESRVDHNLTKPELAQLKRQQPFAMKDDGEVEKL